MQIQVSKQHIKEKLLQLLSTEEGILLLLSGSLVISDFDDPDLAMEEAIKAYNGNRGYFRKIIKKAQELT